jgi:prepilin-type N-terminal cleavage/methylation domain-containing protein
MRKIIIYKTTENQNGFTLIEVLLSIMLLSIILTSFIGLFSQSAIFTQKNGNKLNTMQTAQTVIHMIDSNVTEGDLRIGMTDASGNTITSPVLDDSGNDVSGPIINGSGTVNPNHLMANNTVEEGTYHIDGISNINNRFNITVDTSYNVKAVISKNTTSNFFQIKISVSDPTDSNSLSETYTYFRK